MAPEGLRFLQGSGRDEDFPGGLQTHTREFEGWGADLLQLKDELL